jgi:ElaB/YqjD/DUF883 family membrane-anchored ribosome-binding protein
MESTVNRLNRELPEDRATVRAAARTAAHQAAVAANQEVRRLIADVEELLGRIGDAADPELARLRAKLEAAVATTKPALEAGNRYVRDRTWPAIGVATIGGCALGFLVGRR